MAYLSKGENDLFLNRIKEIVALKGYYVDYYSLQKEKTQINSGYSKIYGENRNKIYYKYRIKVILINPNKPYFKYTKYGLSRDTQADYIVEMYSNTTIQDLPDNYVVASQEGEEELKDSMILLTPKIGDIIKFPIDQEEINGELIMNFYRIDGLYKGMFVNKLKWDVSVNRLNYLIEEYRLGVIKDKTDLSGRFERVNLLNQYHNKLEK